MGICIIGFRGMDASEGRSGGEVGEDWTGHVPSTRLRKSSR